MRGIQYKYLMVRRLAAEPWLNGAFEPGLPAGQIARPDWAMGSRVAVSGLIFANAGRREVVQARGRVGRPSVGVLLTQLARQTQHDADALHFVHPVLRGAVDLADLEASAGQHAGGPHLARKEGAVARE